MVFKFVSFCQRIILAYNEQNLYFINTCAYFRTGVDANNWLYRKYLRALSGRLENSARIIQIPCEGRAFRRTKTERRSRQVKRNLSKMSHEIAVGHNYRRNFLCGRDKVYRA